MANKSSIILWLVLGVVFIALMTSTTILIASRSSVSSQESNLHECEDSSVENDLVCNLGADFDAFPIPLVTYDDDAQTNSSLLVAQQVDTLIKNRGITLSGGEFSNVVPFDLHRIGSDNQLTFIPYDNDATLFIYKGMNTFRIAVRWQNFFTDAGFPLEARLSLLDKVILRLLLTNATVIFTLHDTMIIDNRVIGDPVCPCCIFTCIRLPEITRFWQHVVARYGGPLMVYEVMNEIPSFVDMNSYGLPYIQTAIDVIRTTERARGITVPHLIIVPGPVGSRLDTSFGNQPPFIDSFQDSGNNYAISLRQFFDSLWVNNYINNECMTEEAFRLKLADHLFGVNSFERWMRVHRQKIFITQMVIPKTPTCIANVHLFLSEMEKLKFTPQKGYGVIGWLAWTAGHAWGSEFPFSLAPGGQANDLMWDDLLYEQHSASLPIPIPSIGELGIALVITNELEEPMIHIGGYLPFQFRGDANIEPTDTKPFHSNNRFTTPVGCIAFKFGLRSVRAEISFTVCDSLSGEGQNVLLLIRHRDPSVPEVVIREVTGGDCTITPSGPGALLNETRCYRVTEINPPPNLPGTVS